MARFMALSFAAASLAAAAPEPLITARAELHPRADSSILGYISTSGASSLSDLRSCDFPATLTQSGSYAQCCEKDKPCAFFTSCSAGNVIADSTSIFCDAGYCNTGVILSTAGAQDGHSYLGCWATDLGKDAFTMIQEYSAIGPAPTGLPSSTKDASDARSSDSAASTGTATESSASKTETESSSQTIENSSSSSSPGAAAGVAKPLTGVVGLVAGLAAVL